jgi:hypothetical protein
MITRIYYDANAECVTIEIFDATENRPYQIHLLESASSLLFQQFRQARADKRNHQEQKEWSKNNGI